MNTAQKQPIAAQEKFLDAVGFESGSVQKKLWVGWAGVFGVTSDDSLSERGRRDSNSRPLP